MNTLSGNQIKSGRQHCPNCGADEWLRDQSDVDDITLHTGPPSKPGSLVCSRCGHSWTPDAVG
jgi:ribosomal protein S27AE